MSETQESIDRERRVELLSVVIGGDAYAIESGRVSSIRASVAPTPIPRSGPEVVGAATIEGETIVIADARTLLDAAPSADETLLIVDRGVGEQPVGFILDEATGVDAYDIDRFETVEDATADGWNPVAGAQWFRAAVTADPWLGVLDVERLVDGIDS